MTNELKNLIKTATLNFVKPPKGFPSEVVLLGQRWRVAYANNLIDAHNLLGWTCGSERLIVCDANQDKQSLVDTLIHEILHVGFICSAVYDMDDDSAERVIRSFTPLVVSLLQGNEAFW